MVPRNQSKTDPLNLECDPKALYEISNLIQNSPVNEESLKEILQSMGKLVDFRSASLFVLSRESDKLEEICSIGRTVDLINFVNFNMGAGISAWVAQKKRPIVLNNLRKSQGGSHTKSFLSVPLVFAGEVRGVLNLAHDEPESFTQSDAELIGIAALLVSLIVERIEYLRFESRMRKEIDSLKETLRISREKLGEVENYKPVSDPSGGLAENINNPLAIIAGNAQFLLMTMKNPGSSVLKRLKAIDTEASNLMSLTNRMRSTGEISENNLVSHFPGERN
ncbi:MAG: GAF domain-containing protein [candidate division Zixibacteria bacterium]